MEAKYVAACEAAKKAVWLKKFLSDLGVVRMEQVPITLFGNNSGAGAQSKDPRNHKKGKHIERKAHRKKVLHHLRHCCSRRCSSSKD